MEDSGVLLERFLKFGVVGISGLLVDFGLTFVAKEWLKFSKYVANAIGFSMATITNFVLNRSWTFMDRHESSAWTEFPKFLGFAVAGLLINTLVIYLLNEKARLNFYTAKILAIGIVSIWNFFGNYLYTFTTG